MNCLNCNCDLSKQFQVCGKCYDLRNKEIKALKAETIEAEKAVADLMELNDRLREGIKQLELNSALNHNK